MAGGGGTRLWPASREGRPKPLIPHLPAPDATLLGSTYLRLDRIATPEQIYVVTSQDFAHLVRKALPALPTENILIEPASRNTAPCVAFALGEIERIAAARSRARPDSLAILPADHFVDDVVAFQTAILRAFEISEIRQRVVTLGVQPTYPETGFGYIECSEDADTDPITPPGLPFFRSQSFIEKPELQRAKALVADGRHLWNAGIFIATFDTFERAFLEYAPDIWHQSRRASEELEQFSERFTTILSIPIDKAVMEKLDELFVIPIDVGWSDVGNWGSVSDILDKDEAQNASFEGDLARSVLLDCEQCIVWNEDATIAAVGVQGLAIIASGGHILVCPRERAQDVRMVAEALLQSRRSRPKQG